MWYVLSVRVCGVCVECEGVWSVCGGVGCVECVKVTNYMTDFHQKFMDQ